MYAIYRKDFMRILGNNIVDLGKTLARVDFRFGQHLVFLQEAPSPKPSSSEVSKP